MLHNRVAGGIHHCLAVFDARLGHKPDARARQHVRLESELAYPFRHRVNHARTRLAEVMATDQPVSRDVAERAVLVYEARADELEEQVRHLRQEAS